ncbi:MAG: hemagglutinin repeat-containing protein [Zoogloeaceae bacterium]|nr:hemagglutinin repeat-containing protein [Zoogloeaceae bacterium]
MGSAIVTQGDITFLANHDLTAQAASVTSAAGAITAAAGNDVTLSTATSTYQSEAYRKSKKSNGLSSSKKEAWDSVDRTTRTGSTFSGNSVDIVAGNNITLSGSNVVGDQNVTLSAANDITIEAAQNRSSETHIRKEKKSGLMGDVRSGVMIGSAQSRANLGVTETTAVSSGVFGENVVIDAGRDIAVTGSMALADQDLTLQAGRNITLDAAYERQDITQASSSSSSGFGVLPGLSGNFTVYGRFSAEQDGLDQGQRAVTSLLSANTGDLTLIAGSANSTDAAIVSQGADLLAGGRVSLEADRIALLPATNSSESRAHSESKSFSIGTRPAGVIGGLINQAAERALDAHEGTGNDRLDDALALKASYDAYKVFNPAQGAADETNPDAVKNPSEGAFGISISIGTSKSESDYQSAGAQALGTNIQAREIDLTARETDLHLQGAKLQAENISLSAKRDILLEAAANTASVKSSNESSGMSAGVTVTFGQQTGVSFQLGAQRAEGRANGSETIWDNTLITATDNLTVTSGNDTTLRGAQLAANQVTLDVGRDLTIETLQDRSHYESEQKSGGFGVNVCVPPLCYGLSSLTVNSASQEVKHDYQSAQGQSGIAAGSGGFDITVANHTELIGAAITSEAEAQKNRLTTGSLGYTDLTNTQTTEADADSWSLTGSFALGGKANQVEGQQVAAADAVIQGLNNVSPNWAGNRALDEAMPDNGDEQSRTLAVISPSVITITGTGNTERDAASQAAADELTQRDAATANEALTNTLTLQQTADLERQLARARQDDEAARLMAQTGQQLAGEIGTIAQNKINAILAQIEKATKDGDTERVAALNVQLAETKDKWGEGGLYRVALHTLAGALTGNLDGALGAGLSALAVPEIAEVIKQLDLPTEVKQVLIALSGTAIGAAVGGDQGATAGLNQTVNNYLRHAEATRLATLLDKKYSGQCDAACKQEIAELVALDQARDQELGNCAGIQSADCDRVRQDVRNAAAEYIRLNSPLKLFGEPITPEQKTRRLAEETMNGVFAAQAAGYVQSGLDSLVGLGNAALTGIQALIGDPEAQSKIKEGAGSAFVYITNPDNLPYLIGALTPDQRKQLAQAYERGDGATVGKMLGEQIANLPIGGGLGTIKKIDKAIDLVNTAKMAEKIPSKLVSSEKYVSSPKHDPVSGWGTPMDLPDSVAQEVLDRSTLVGKQRYGLQDGKVYEFQPDNAGGWHGYPIPGTQVPTSFLRDLRNSGQISNAQYNSLIKGK